MYVLRSQHEPACACAIEREYMTAEAKRADSDVVPGLLGW